MKQSRTVPILMTIMGVIMAGGTLGLTLAADVPSTEAASAQSRQASEPKTSSRDLAMIVSSELTYKNRAPMLACDSCAPVAVPTATPHPVEDALAASFLLTIDLFPLGWAQGPASPQDPPDECTPTLTAGRTGRAVAGSFSRFSDWVDQVAVVYESPAAVDRATQLLVDSLGCTVARINEGKANTNESTLSATLFQLSFAAPPGSRTSAWRVAEVSTEVGTGSWTEFFYDVVYITKGRYASSIIAGSVYSPFSTYMLHDLVEIVTGRMPKN